MQITKTIAQILELYETRSAELDTLLDYLGDIGKIQFNNKMKAVNTQLAANNTATSSEAAAVANRLLLQEVYVFEYPNL